MILMNLGDISSKIASNHLFPILNRSDENIQGKKLFISKSGIKILYRDRSLDRLVLLEQFSDTGYDDIIVGKSGVVIDIGGHIGTTSLYYGQEVGKEGAVYSIEPVAENYEILSQNIELNQMSWVKPYREAIVGRSDVKSINVILDKNNSAGHSIHESNIDTSMRERVEALTLERFVEREQIDSIDLLHIDAEGAEFDILLNSDPDFISTIPLIVLEYHDAFDTGHHHSEILELLAELGYEYQIKVNLLPKILRLQTGLIVARKKLNLP